MTSRKPTDNTEKKSTFLIKDAHWKVKIMRMKAQWTPSLCPLKIRPFISRVWVVKPSLRLHRPHYIQRGSDQARKRVSYRKFNPRHVDYLMVLQANSFIRYREKNPHDGSFSKKKIFLRFFFFKFLGNICKKCHIFSSSFYGKIWCFALPAWKINESCRYLNKMLRLNSNHSVFKSTCVSRLISL